MTDLDLASAIASTEARLLGALNQGLQQVNTALTNLIEMHHKAILDQERRNASFASSDRVEALAGRIEGINAILSARDQRFENIEAGLARVERQVGAVEAQISSRSVSFLTTTTGYLVTALLLVSSNVLTFLLAHVMH